MSHHVAFHQGLNCLLRQNRSSKKEIHNLEEIKTCDPSLYGMDPPDVTVPKFMEISIGPKRVKVYMYAVS